MITSIETYSQWRKSELAAYSLNFDPLIKSIGSLVGKAIDKSGMVQFYRHEDYPESKRNVVIDKGKSTYISDKDLGKTTIKVAIPTVAALSALSFIAYKLIKNKKEKKLDEASARIKELEEKAKNQGFLSRTDLNELVSLTKKLSKAAVKDDPSNFEKIQNEINSTAQKIK